MDFKDTVKGSLLEGFYPAGWDMAKIDECCNPNNKVEDRQSFWNKDFNPVRCETLGEFDTYMGHEIALAIKNAKEAGEKIAFILPVGPMGMYKWAVYFLKAWNIKCDHVYTFNMDEWSDADGNTLPSNDPAAFQNAMCNALFDPLGELTVPENQRNFATKENLPTYPEKIAKLKAEGVKLVLVYGIGRMCHIAFWEPQFAEDFASVDEWKSQPYRIGAKLHQLLISGVQAFRQHKPGNLHAVSRAIHNSLGNQLPLRYIIVLEHLSHIAGDPLCIHSLPLRVTGTGRLGRAQKTHKRTQIHLGLLPLRAAGSVYIIFRILEDKL
ncbi:MAG: hypothetical protein IJN40_03055, partial [Clostridia bacterium]|nr:hypothetical protein [Clostridia bacterium]